MYFMQEFGYFKRLFGFTESVKSVYKNFKLNDSENGVLITSLVNGTEFNSGFFKLVTVESFPPFKPRGCGRFFVINGKGRYSERYELVNVLQLQSLPENNGATFQAASNFNCLEFASYSQTAADGISGYENDPTQGPNCAIACPPALLFRNYFVPVSSKEKGQIKGELNLLSKTPIHLVNGKTHISGKDTESIDYQKFDWTNENNYFVGMHSNCQVCLNVDKNGKYYITDGLISSDDKNVQSKEQNMEKDVEMNGQFTVGKDGKSGNETGDKIQIESKEKEIQLEGKDESEGQTVCSENEDIQPGDKEIQPAQSQPPPLSASLPVPPVPPISIPPEPQTVHHVYAAALNFGACVRNEMTANITRHLLRSEYRSTILAAWENSLRWPHRAGARKLYLTKLGGGVFFNPDEFIFDAILANEDVIINSGLDVYLVCYEGFSRHPKGCKIDYFEPIMKKTGGNEIKA